MNRQFTEITPTVLAEDKDFFQYLWAARIKAGDKGGTFIGTRAVGPEAFRKYGIVLPKGGMILPQVEPAALQAILKGAAPPVPDEYVMDRDMEYFIEEDPQPANG